MMLQLSGKLHYVSPYVQLFISHKTGWEILVPQRTKCHLVLIEVLPLTKLDYTAVEHAQK